MAWSIIEWEEAAWVRRERKNAVEKRGKRKVRREGREDSRSVKGGGADWLSLLSLSLSYLLPSTCLQGYKKSWIRCRLSIILIRSGKKQTLFPSLPELHWKRGERGTPNEGRKTGEGTELIKSNRIELSAIESRQFAEEQESAGITAF